MFNQASDTISRTQLERDFYIPRALYMFSDTELGCMFLHTSFPMHTTNGDCKASALQIGFPSINTDITLRLLTMSNPA